MLPKKHDYELVIIGGGLSGLSAAVAAEQAGLAPLVLEKGHTLGGDGNYVEGALGVDSYLQQKEGIKIDRLKLLHEELQYSHYEANAAHLNKFINNSGATIDWLHDLGVKFAKVGAQGDSWPTIHSFAGGGHAAIQTLLKQVKKSEVVTEAKAARLLYQDGRVTGLTVADEATGQEQDVTAKNVILATGGYVDNPALVKQHQSFDDRLMAVSDGKSTGDGMQLAWEVGADHYRMGAIQYGGGAIYDRQLPPFMHMASQLAAAATQEAILWVNERGERFVNEDVNDNMCHAGNAILTQAKVYSILDQGTVDHLAKVGLYKELGNTPFSPAKLEKLPEEIENDIGHHAKYLTKGDTLAELAAKLHLPALEETVASYNQLAAGGEDPVFGKAKQYLTALTTGPFYAVELGVGMACALGGLKVDTNNRVLNAHGFPIPGLFSIGNDAAGMLVGDTYAVTLPGSTAGYAAFSARNAVSTIAKN